MTNESYIRLPEDQYRHLDGSKPAQAEWWWHIGTLRQGNRVFGFEINAAGFAPKGTGPEEWFLLAYIMLTDVKTNRHYQVVSALPWNDAWAQTDTSKPWTVNVGEPNQLGAISMEADGCGPMAMHVRAKFKDATFNSEITFDLRLNPQLPPLLVFGTGRSPVVDPAGPTPLQRYNFYYSLPRNDTSGTIAINGESFDVQGTTWMDHEYGAWHKSIKWILQDITLDNGACISVFTDSSAKIIENKAVQANYTLLGPDGKSTFSNDAVVTPLAPSWTSPSGVTYFPTVKVQIPKLNAEFVVKSLVTDQEFWNPKLPGSQVYEGVAIAEGTYQGKPTVATAWNEQHLND